MGAPGSAYLARHVPWTKEIVDCGAGFDRILFDGGLDVLKANCEKKVRGLVTH
jgi:hypothetical protein